MAERIDGLEEWERVMDGKRDRSITGMGRIDGLEGWKCGMHGRKAEWITEMEIWK